MKIIILKKKGGILFESLRPKDERSRLSHEVVSNKCLATFHQGFIYLFIYFNINSSDVVTVEFVLNFPDVVLLLCEFFRQKHLINPRMQQSGRLLHTLQ